MMNKSQTQSSLAEDGATELSPVSKRTVFRVTGEIFPWQKGSHASGGRHFILLPDGRSRNLQSFTLNLH